MLRMDKGVDDKGHDFFYSGSRKDDNGKMLEEVGVIQTVMEDDYGVCDRAIRAAACQIRWVCVCHQEGVAIKKE